MKAKTLVEKNFKLGEVITVNAVNYKMFGDEEFNTFVNDCLKRYKSLDWGDSAEWEKRHNDYAIHNGMRVIATYIYKDGTEVIIITERNRRKTYVFLSCEAAAVLGGEIND